MKNRKNKTVKKLNKMQSLKLDITCPYCGAKAILQDKSYVHGENTIGGGKLYVCMNYPSCDSYVSAHNSTNEPQGTLANKSLRRKRIETHKVVNELIFKNIMAKKELYIWLGCKLGLDNEKAHIAMLDYKQCDELIAYCKKLLEYKMVS